MTTRTGVWGWLGTIDQQRPPRKRRTPRRLSSISIGNRPHRFERLEDRTLLSISGHVPLETLDVSRASDYEGHGQWLDFDPNDGLGAGAVANIQLTSNALEGITGEITIPGAWLEAVTLGGVEFNRVTIPGFGYSHVIGEPQLPVLRSMIVMPDGAEAVATIDGQSQLLSLRDLGAEHLLAPVQTPVPKLPGAWESAPLDFNEAAYQTDGFASEADIWLADGGTVAGLDLSMLEIAPFSYSPTAEEISLYNSLTFRVDFLGGQQKTTPLTSQEDARLSNLALNYDSVIDKSVKSTKRLLIIVHDDFAGELTTFIDHKTSLGWTVDVADTSTAGTTNTAIRTYIQARYNVLDTRPDAVLLVGDTDRIPYFIGSGEGAPKTDLYYGCMDGGDDWYQEFPVGRFSVDTTAELANVIEKTIWYEASSSGDWTTHAVFMAGDDNYDITEGTHNYVIDTYMDPLEYTSDRLYEVTYDATTQDVSDSFNDGRLLGIYSGHGGENSWADGPAFSQADVRNLTNEGMYSLVASFACVTGSYDLDECFTETWLVTEDNGAVAVIGSSVNSYWDEDDILEKRLFDAIYDEGIMGYASAWMRADELLRDHYGATSTVRRYFEMYNVMGDPTVELIPLGPDEDGPAVASHTPGTTIDVQSEVTLHFNERMDTSSFAVADDVVSFTGPSGDLLSEITGHTWTDDRTLEVQFNQQSSIGSYALVIGPNVTDDDPSYNPMDQDGDGVHGEAIEDRYTADFEIVPDVSGPVVVGHSPGSSADPQSAVIFQFNELLETGSFVVADDVVSFTGPSGDLTPAITGFTWIDGRSLEVQFSEQATPGTYTMVIGPNITDDGPSYNAMNQDGDATGGETSEDTYTARFEIIDALYYADMSTDPNWTLAGDWAWGVPTGTDDGPSSGYSGEHVIGYNLSGDYADNMVPTYATTPAFDCSGYDTVTLSFYRWLGIESATYDHAKVEVSHNGVNWTTVWDHNGSSLADSNWVYQEFDISAVADDQPTVYVRWVMGSTDSSVTYCGWNIDDVLVTGAVTGPDVDGPLVVSHTPGATAAALSTLTFQFNEVMDPGSFSVADDVVSFTGPSGDLMSNIKGSNWIDARTLELQFDEQTAAGTYTMVIGPNICDDGPSYNQMNQDGNATGGEVPSDCYTATFDIVASIYYADMETDPQWTLDPGSGSSRWEWGQPTGSGGDHGEPDPTVGHTGSSVMGYNLAGDYANNLSTTQWATTPAFDCSSYGNVQLEFHRWLNVEQSNYDHAYLQVSNNGTNWTQLWTNTAEMTDSSWALQTFDLSSVADGESTVYLRWGLGVTDGSWQYSGWNIDDVIVTGTSTFADSDFNHDRVTDGDDFLIWQFGFGSFSGGGATHRDGDSDGDGDVDGDDFLIWQAGFGIGGGAAGGAFTGPSTRTSNRHVIAPLIDNVWEEYGRKDSSAFRYRATAGHDWLDDHPARRKLQRSSGTAVLETLAKDTTRDDEVDLRWRGLRTAMNEFPRYR